MQAHMRFTFDTDLAPERVVAALTDFSAERLAIWPSLDPEKFEVYELGSSSAFVREGTASPSIWVKERYDWSRPGRVVWTLAESNVFRPGTTIELVAEPNGGGGSRVRMDATRAAASPKGYLVVAGLALFGERFLTSTYKRVFDRLADAER